jgi:competence protein ComFC
MILLNDFFKLIFPVTCAACGKVLIKNERVICVSCNYTLPRTNFHYDQNNPVSQIFWGRIRIENATAFYFFNKGSKFRHLLHELKYNNRKDIGLELGRIFGYELSPVEGFSQVDMVIPVPLHRKKLKKRGFNQSEYIARGISEALNKPLDVLSIVRSVNSSTQTRKTRYDRWLNVEGIFTVINPDILCGKHILLVDDVITTGATLEACATEILKIEGTKVSVAVLAVA